MSYDPYLSQPSQAQPSQAREIALQRRIEALEYENRRLEAAYRDSIERERELRNFFESTRDAIVIFDRNLRLLHANPASVGLLGYADRDEMEGIGIESVFADANILDDLLRDMVFSGSADYFETSLCRKTSRGERPEVIGSGFTHLDARGGIVHFEFILTDISERKRMEQRIRQSRKVEAIGILAGGIAHDFNNILSPIMGYTDLIRTALESDSPLRRYTEEILRAAERARDLVNQILTYSRRGDSQRRPVRLQVVIHEALRLLRCSIPATIRMHQHINPRCGAVAADPTQIHQIIMNLAINAFHAMEATGGDLIISLAQVRRTEDTAFLPDLPPGEYAKLAVSDTGTGIAPEQLERVFDPYFTTKEVGKGSGLGLSVVQGIVRSYGGEIRIESTPGSGTDVEIFLPIAESGDEDSEGETCETLLGGTEEHVLLVDDDEAVLKMGRRILRHLGYRVSAFNVSTSAAAAFKATPDAFDVVMTDMTMPEMTGLELAEAVRDIRPDIPVLICTGYRDQVDAVRYKALGIYGPVAKPMAMADIAWAIREALGGCPR